MLIVELGVGGNLRIGTAERSSKESLHRTEIDFLVILRPSSSSFPFFEKVVFWRFLAHQFPMIPERKIYLYKIILHIIFRLVSNCYFFVVLQFARGNKYLVFNFFILRCII